MPPERGEGKLKYESGCCCPGLGGPSTGGSMGLSPGGDHRSNSQFGPRELSRRLADRLGFPSMGRPPTTAPRQGQGFRTHGSLGPAAERPPAHFALISLCPPPLSRHAQASRTS